MPRGPEFDTELGPVPSSQHEGAAACLGAHLAKAQSSQLQGELLRTLSHLQPGTGCSAEGWLSFWCAVLVFDMPDINYQDRLFELHKHLWMHMKWRRCKNFKLGFSSWNPSGWRASYVELMLLATFFTISHPIIIYILSYVIFPRPQPL